MDSSSTSSPPSAAALTSPAARNKAAAVQSTKLTCLRRYVTDSTARRLMGKCAPGASSQVHKSEHTTRRKEGNGVRVDANALRHEKKLRMRNGSGMRLLHDTLGEAEAPLPRVPVGQCSGSGLPSSSSSRRAAVSFDALQFARVQRPGAGGKAEAYSLAAEDKQFLNSLCSPGDTELVEGEEKSCESADSEDEEVIIVDDMGRNVCFDHAQQRQVKALLEAEEQTVQLKLGLRERSSQSETATITSAFRARSRSPSVQQKPSVSASINTSRQAVSSPRGAEHLLGCTKDVALSIGREQNLGNLRSSHEKKEKSGTHGAFDELNSRGERRNSCGAVISAGGDFTDDKNDAKESHSGISRLCAAVDHVPIDKDGDLCCPRRNYDQRLHRGRVGEGGRSSIIGCSTSNFAVEEQGVSSFYADENGCDVRDRTRIHVQSGEIISPCEETSHFLDRRAERHGQQEASTLLRDRSDVEVCRTAAGIADAHLTLPDACEPSDSGPLVVRRKFTTKAHDSGACEGHISSLEDKHALMSEKTCTDLSDNAPSLPLVEEGMRLGTACRGSRERTSVNPASDETPIETRRQVEGVLPSKTVVYRDRDGRIITEEEWLELKDPLTRRRRQEKFKKERPPRVELAWGGGLVQQVEKAQAAAEEAYIGQQPLARYELDKDFDLELQRKQRWEDPLAKVPSRSCRPQKDAAVPSTAEANAHTKAPADGNSKRATDKPRCPFDAPRNRFGIEPGYRWDGVVRGNGYEDRRLEAINKRRLEERQKHTNNVADM